MKKAVFPCLMLLAVWAVSGWSIPSTGAAPISSDDDTSGNTDNRPNYEHRLITWGKGNTVDIRFSPRTGQSSVVNEHTMDRVSESGQVPRGNYDVQVVGGEGDWWAVRVERKSGKTWLLTKGAWKDMLDTDELPAGTYVVELRWNNNTSWGRRFDQASGRLWYWQWQDKEQTYQWIEEGR